MVKNPSANTPKNNRGWESLVDTIPPSSIDLISLLTESFRLPLIAPGMSTDEIFYAAGQKSVVDYLRQLQDELENPDDD